MLLRNHADAREYAVHLLHGRLKYAAAVYQVNDSLAETQLCLRFTALEIAAGFLHLADTTIGVVQQLPSSKQRGWWEAVGVSLKAIEEVGHAMCDAAEGRTQHGHSTAAVT